MSYGPGLLKREFKRYSLENNLYRIKIEKLLQQINAKFNKSREDIIIPKITDNKIGENLEKNKDRLKEAVEKLKKDNRNLRDFNQTFKYTLENASIGKSSRSNSGRGKKSKNKKNKKGGRRRKTRRKTRRKSKKGGFFSFNFFKKGCDKYQTSERIADKKNCKKDKNCYYEVRGSAGTFCYNKPNKSKKIKKRKKKGTRKRK